MTSDDLGLKKINETGNYFLKEMKNNDLISEKNKKVGRSLTYFQHFLVSISAVSGYV